MISIMLYNILLESFKKQGAGNALMGPTSCRWFLPVSTASDLYNIATWSSFQVKLSYNINYEE